MKANREIKWHNIRDKEKGFEDLCAQLAYSENPPNAKFVPLNRNKDGGTECFWEFQDGSRWGWQAKYFVNSFGHDQWRQIDNSVKRALDKHKNLTRYYICVPYDLTLEAVENILPAKVDGWKQLAESQSMNVEFIWWGEFMLTEKLMKPKHAGRCLYWFDTDRFDSDWFKDKVDIHTDSAGARYTAKLEPELHINLPIANEFENLGRTDYYVKEIKSHAGEIRRTLGALRLPNYQGFLQKEPSFKITSNKFEDSLKKVLTQLAELNPEPSQDPGFQNISEPVQNAIAATETFLKDLVQRTSKYAPKQKKRQHIPSNLEDLIKMASEGLPPEDLHYSFSAMKEILPLILEKIDTFKDKRLMIISGDAGIGKTHLLCDVAKKRVDDGLPTVLLMGHRFTSTDDPWSQAREHLDLPGVSKEEFVGILEAAAQRRKRRALLMIDAVNEGQGRTIWLAHLKDFLHYLEKSPWIGVVLSVRKNYEDLTIPEDIQRRAVPEEHSGFEDKKYEAIRTFFAHHKLKLPSVPILNSGFNNPLFLKIICKGLKSRGERELPRDLYGISDAFEWYLEDANERYFKYLKARERKGYIQSALRKFAQRAVEGSLDRDVAEEVINGSRSSPDGKDSLCEWMISEDLLNCARPQKGREIVYISYNRFADYLIVDSLLEKHLNPDEPEMAFAKGGGLAFLCGENPNVLPGLIDELSIKIPERTGRELVEFAPSLVKRQDVRAAFLRSLTWRGIGTLSATTKKILNKSLEIKEDKKDVLNTLLTVATVPNHPYNAKFLDTLLSQYSMADRDAWWSTYLHNAYDSQGPVDRLLDWTLQISSDMKPEKNVVKLASITLAWMLTSSNRFVRDRATKALVVLLTGRLDILHKILKQFAGVDDLYVSERLYAVAYGVAMRNYYKKKDKNNKKKKMEDIAQWVYDKVFADGKPPVHMLLRDYARGVVERVLYLGSEINIERDLIEPPYDSDPPRIPTEQEMNQFTADWKPASYEEGETEWARNRIVESVMIGDFARYVIGVKEEEDSSSQTSQSSDESRENHILRALQRYILKRVFDLGWTVERFGEFDTREVEYHATASSKAERIGKKYQWIAFYEIMAYASDDDESTAQSSATFRYEGPWQLRRPNFNLRDIDPSVTLRSNKGRRPDENYKSSWWSGEGYASWGENEPPGTWLECEDDMREIRRLSKDLLKVTDKADENKSWLNLYSSFIWEQPDPVHSYPRMINHFSTGCFLSNHDADAFINWVQGLTPAKMLAIDPHKIARVFFGEYGWSPAFGSHYKREFDKPIALEKFPGDVRATSLDCSYSPSAFDCSVNHFSAEPPQLHKMSLLVPHFDVIDKLGLRWTRKNAEFECREGKRAAFDPSATEDGPTSLLFCEDLMRRYLKENELTLCWIIRSDKVVSDGRESEKETARQCMSYSVYFLEEQGPQRKFSFHGKVKFGKSGFELVN